MADKRDFYEVLGLEKSASDDDIKRAYRKLAKQYHPDLNPGDKTAEEKFKEIGEAYEVLSDAQKKQLYDTYGHAGVDPNYGGGGGGFGGFDDFGGFGDIGSIFESFFGGGGSRRTGPARGESIRAAVVLTFEEAAFGCKKTVGISRVEPCSSCEGTGAESGSTAERCSTCGGAGQVRTTRRTPLGNMASTETCPACYGKGKIIKNPCKSCGGEGRLRQSRSIDINIPAGIDDGQTISLRSEGHAGKNGGPSGDLLVTVQIRQHEIFRREGTSVLCDINVSFVEAALGAELEVTTLDGKVKYTMPEGTQTGTTFRLRGKGIVRLNTSTRGDQFVRVNVEIPKTLTARQREILQEYAAEIGVSTPEKKKGFFDKKRK